ncbi:AAA family ATPase [Sphingomonas sp. AOB5]|uniref:AAA family ATPase n=1 Tax=Sphingomonas sp. AOB5 TaxID=3034017 RepID=UPI0023FA3280|nr:bifunctional aminoglycoside phosphotransferase/ATP-binding protein [Sphingomonas sp. AOB5]MDF7776814.1 AAA family ATPase [Sphingomonas sp. AOB5]
MSVPPDMLLSEVAERRDLDHALLMRLADRISAMHAAAPEAAGSSAAIRATLPEQRAELARHAAHLAERAAAGRVRRGHGALRLDHIALTETGPEPFGSQDVAIDILFDLANLLEDMWCRGLRAPANMIANRYVDVMPQGARGWALLPLFLSIHANDVDLLADAPPRLIAIGGLSGTGKSTLARALGCWMNRAPGARVLRSDVFRKRIMGLPPEARLPPSHYTAQSDAETWEALFESAYDHLSCGTSVIIDAVFMRRSERDVAEMLADRARVSFTGLWLEAPERDRIARVNARSGDASDAGAEVVREQSRRSAGELYGWHRMRVNRPPETVIAAARAVIDRQRR